MSAWSRMKAQLALAADVGPWSLHDLRRTCRTLMTRCKVAEPVAELAIGHAKGPLIGLYDLESNGPPASMLSSGSPITSRS